jgi:hypothetical protein
MQTLRALRIAALVVIILGLTGCGSSRQAAAARGADVVPASVPGFVSVDSDLGSEQWRTVDKLLDSFPDKPKLLRMLRSALRENSKLDYESDVKPALGAEIDIAWLDAENAGMNVVGLTKPKDEENFRRMITKWSRPDRMFFGNVDGWLVFSDSQAKVDRFQAEAKDGGKLADQQEYKDALAELPDETLAHVFASGTQLTKLFKKFAGGTPELWRQTTGDLEFIAAGLAAEDEGLRLVFSVGGESKLNDNAKSFESELVNEVPADALAFVSFRGSDFSKGFREGSGAASAQSMRALEQILGFRLNSLLGLLTDEVAFYVRPQRPIPELTLVFKVPDEQKGLARIQEVMAGLAKVAHARTGHDAQAGVPLRTVDFEEGFVVRYGAFDGKVIVTTGTAAVDELRSHGTKLPDDDDYREALTTAGVPDRSGAFVYVNLKRTVALFRLLAKAEGEPVSDEIWANLAPLRSFVAWGVVTERTSMTTAFLQVD